MKIFPQKNYSITLNTNSSLALSELKNQTLHKEQYVANWNSQIFIGLIDGDVFEINISKKWIGEICIFNGYLKENKGSLKVRTSRFIKIIFIIIVIFSLSGIIMATLQNELKTSFHILLSLLTIRFIILELSFQIISKLGIEKLTKTISIKTINNKI